MQREADRLLGLIDEEEKTVDEMTNEPSAFLLCEEERINEDETVSRVAGGSLSMATSVIGYFGAFQNRVEIPVQIRFKHPRPRRFSHPGTPPDATMVDTPPRRLSKRPHDRFKMRRLMRTLLL